MTENMELTSNPDAEELEETTIMGRTVYVSQRSQEAYVEFQDRLVSMTNLRAWNTLMERAKVEVLDGYETERTLAQKRVDQEVRQAASKVEEAAMELHREASSIRRLIGSEETDG